MATKYERSLARIRKDESNGNEGVEGTDTSGRTWNRYGLTETEWAQLTPEQRVVHANRHLPYGCEHAAPVDVSEVYSYDPYFHTPHMIPHSIERFFLGTCECQACVGKFGIERGTEVHVVNETQLLEKLQGRKKHVPCVCDACWRNRPRAEGSL